MDNEKLNEKLTKWAGFKFVDKPRYFAGFPGAAVANYWITPDGVETPYSPNFVFDLTACFEWLVPKTLDIIAHKFKMAIPTAWAKLFTIWQQEMEDADYEPALSLCLAIERLIEAENDR